MNIVFLFQLFRFLSPLITISVFGYFFPLPLNAMSGTTDSLVIFTIQHILTILWLVRAWCVPGGGKEVEYEDPPFRQRLCLSPWSFFPQVSVSVNSGFASLVSAVFAFHDTQVPGYPKDKGGAWLMYSPFMGSITSPSMHFRKSWSAGTAKILMNRLAFAR